MGEKFLHVVAAVIYDNEKQKILIAKRPDHQHQGGKWEFPGGKVEANESIQQALQRELFEELGITVTDVSPLIQIRHAYPDQSVFLDVYNVTHHRGKAFGKEGQAMRWVQKNQLSEYTFPEANRPILRAIDLPEYCLVTPEPSFESSSESSHQNEFLASIDKVLESGIKLIQFRAKQLPPEDYLSLANRVIERAHQYQVKVILNSPPEVLEKTDGLHLTSYQLMALKSRPTLAEHQLLSASCHNEKELKQAAKISADFVFLSPVKQTRSHPELTGMGWNHFQQLASHINIPVYALGGMEKEDLMDAKSQGAQGIAAISGLWSGIPK